MKYLKQYVEVANEMARLFSRDSKFKGINLNNLTHADADRIRNSLECDLSPENLHCDGEASPEAVRLRSRLLNGALAELDAMKINYKAPTQ